MSTFSSDFGRSLTIAPEKVVREGADGEIGDLMAAAAASGKDTAVRGAGRSCNTQTLASGTVLDNFREDAEPRFRGSETLGEHPGEHLVEVPSGITWYALEKWLNAHGRANPVLPSYLNLTVGGTLSIGGFGHGSLRSGLQIDQVEEIELVDGTGRSRTCSRRENSELFRFALGGLGQVGFIRTALLRTVPYRAVTPVSRIPHTGISDLAEFMKGVAADPAVSGYFGMYDRTSWYSQIALAAEAPEAVEAAEPGTVLPAPDYTLLLHQEVDQHLVPVLQDESRVNLWADYVFDEAGFEGITKTLEELTRESPFADNLISLYFLVIKRPEAAVPFVFAPSLDTPVQYGIGVFTTIEKSDSHAVAETRRVLRELLAACAQAKGRPYLYGSHELDAELLEGFYGADVLRRLEALREEHALTRFNPRAFGGVRP
ncbi:FAD-binding protein [Streptomyces sp. NPDC056773]|uniref:FAD-binding protein n=1 Tax=unclassified Streptomyces TaxID=2593676 RepID=UPI0036BEB5FF